MGAALLPYPLWYLVEPFLPMPPRRPQCGRPRVSDRACLTGIVSVLRSGIPCQMLPQELGCGSGMTCWRRLRDWQVVGVWDLIHFALLDWLARYDQIDWSRVVTDSCSIRAGHGGDRAGLVNTAPFITTNPGHTSSNSQGGHGIDSGGAARRNVAGGKGGQKEEHRDAGEGCGIGGADAE
jgi:transposase